ncbi:guanyl-specific ribonuclease F1 [Teratosphaeria destructans]|uniref:ribonuclease T1 n=1 Tax=Teratosphaeria destructans TaxID=418781 RepID=A0A9W7W5S3_9PEZI|nr:guanyl-specific ribonuclease F1 [Teratosphaeria destructans]
MRSPLLTVMALATTVLAFPTLSKRQSSTTCGNNYYTTDQVSDALNRGYNYYQEGEQVGDDDYPHTYNNYEGFDFPVSGPYQEFPIEESGVYTGGSPGADRVVFNTDGEYAGAITHTGASGNDFVGCSGTS